MKPSTATQSSKPPEYPVWGESCWIQTAAESANGTGPRIGRLVTRAWNCLDGRRQRVCHPLGFRERGVGELPLYKPLYVNNIRQRNHGYSRVTRRRPSSAHLREVASEDASDDRA
jgi:hypothetical protein